jgi:hypothetical protein
MQILPALGCGSVFLRHPLIRVCKLPAQQLRPALLAASTASMDATDTREELLDTFRASIPPMDGAK